MIPRRAASLLALVLGLAALLAGCTTDRQTDPQRSATEQLLISTAADRAAANIKLQLDPGTKAFLDAGNFEGLDGKYAIAAIRSSLLRQGVCFVDDRKNAAAIVEIRSGALSIDEHSDLVGIPSITLPVPLTGPLPTPELALYKYEERVGVAKFGATAYDAKDGHFIDESTPPLGTARIKKHVVLLFSWTEDDVHGNDPKGKTEQQTSVDNLRSVQ